MAKKIFKLVDYEINNNELKLNLKLNYSKESFNSETALEFFNDNFNKIRKEIIKLIKKNKINFREGNIRVLVNGSLLTTLVLMSGCNANLNNSETEYSNNLYLSSNEVLSNSEFTSNSGSNNDNNDNNNYINDIINIGINEQNSQSNNVSNPEIALKQMNLVLIAGHAGRNDPGAVYNNRYESEYAQELVNLITAEINKLENVNINVILEPKDMAVNDEIAFLKKAKSDYAISIHFNAGGGSGTEIIVPYDFSDLTIAEETINNFKRFNQPIRPTSLYSKSSAEKIVRKNGIKVASQKDYYGIIKAGKDIKIHSEIIEVDFIDNEKNMNFYDANKIKYAKGIADAIGNYYQKNFVA